MLFLHFDLFPLCLKPGIFVLESFYCFLSYTTKSWSCCTRHRHRQRQRQHTAHSKQSDDSRRDDRRVIMLWGLFSVTLFDVVVVFAFITHMFSGKVNFFVEIVFECLCEGLEAWVCGCFLHSWWWWCFN